MREIKDNDVLTVGLFKILAEEIILPKFVTIESKMMDGFEALDRKIDIVDKESERRDGELSARIDAIATDVTRLDAKVDSYAKESEDRDRSLIAEIHKQGKESEHRDRALSAQIQHLAFSTADWDEIT